MGKPFSSKRLLVLQIDNGVTQVAEIRMSSKNIQVAKSFSVLTPVGTVEDDGTLVADAAFARIDHRIHHRRHRHHSQHAQSA